MRRGPLKVVPIASAVPDDGQMTAQNKVKADTVLKTKAIKKNKELSAIWDEIVPSILKLGFATAGDAIVFEMLVSHIAIERIGVESILSRRALFMENWKGDMTKDPTAVELRQTSEIILKYANVLGITFQARARTPMQTESDEENPFDSATG